MGLPLAKGEQPRFNFDYPQFYIVVFVIIKN